jgi:hypothetical protein
VTRSQAIKFDTVQLHQSEFKHEAVNLPGPAQSREPGQAEPVWAGPSFLTGQWSLSGHYRNEDIKRSKFFVPHSFSLLIKLLFRPPPLLDNTTHNDDDRNKDVEMGKFFFVLFLATSHNDNCLPRHSTTT